MISKLLMVLIVDYKPETFRFRDFMTFRFPKDEKSDYLDFLYFEIQFFVVICIIMLLISALFYGD